MLDVPVGSGRFLTLYRKLHVRWVNGVDVSEEMLALARAKKTAAKLDVGSATALDFPDDSFETVVCVRFLDLIDEEAARQVVRELCRVAVETIILTVRLGEKYVPKSNTATHDERKFRALLSRLGWRSSAEEKIFDAGWTVMRLEPKADQRVR